MKPTLAAFLLLVQALLLPAQPLTGSYTVGTGGNFQNLGAALSALSAQGVAGPVFFVVSGVQTGPFTIGAIPGQGPASPVSFDGLGGASLSTSTLPALTLNGCTHVTFQNFTGSFAATGAAVSVMGSSSNCTFSACHFTMPVVTTPSSATVFSVTGGSATRITQSNFGGGYEAFAHTGGTGFTVERCRVTGGGFWIARMEAADGIFRNNFVTGNSNYGLRAGAAATNLKILGNSFRIDHPAAASQYCALRWYGATSLNTEVIGNAIHETFNPSGQGYIMWCSGALKPTVMNGNCFWPVGALSLIFSATNLTLAGWQAMGYDLNSLQADPLFVNASPSSPDLHIQQTSPCASAGLSHLQLTDDFDGQSRVVPYDIGADEITINNLLTAITSGGGTGNLFLSLDLIDPTATEGYCLVSLATSFPLGTGPALGLWPDQTFWTILFTVPMQPGNPFHFPIPWPGVFPDQPVVLPNGYLANLAGQTWDVVALLLGPLQNYVGRSNVQRLAW
jgi:hypothetical protein